MKNEIRANYIKEYPQSKRLLEKISSKEKTDKGQACALIREVEELGVECLGMLEKALAKETTVTYKDENYVCTEPYEYTLAEVKENYKIEQAKQRERDKAKKKMRREIREIHEKFWVPIRELKPLYRQYLKYIQAQSEGKMQGAPQHMTFRRYFLWAERGYPMDERSHQSTVVNVVLPPVEEPSEEVREALRAKYNFHS